MFAGSVKKLDSRHHVFQVVERQRAADQRKTSQGRLPGRNDLLPVLLGRLFEVYGQHAAIRGLPVRFDEGRVARDLGTKTSFDIVDQRRDGATRRYILEID